MFILELTYVAPTERVEAVRVEHLAWVDAQFQAGTFLLSGRKSSLDGGVILVAGNDRPAVEELTAGDPFTVAGVCEYRITELVATRGAPGLESYLDVPPA